MAQLVEVQVDGRPMNICTASPAGNGPFPAVLVTIHGGGLDDFEFDLADKLAAEGYIAAAPDIFHRQPDEKDSAVRRSRLKDEEIIRDIKAGISWLEESGKADMKRVAILGHCMGGRHAYLGAAALPVFKCIVAYYSGNMFVSWGGSGPAPFDRLKNIKVPVIGFYGNDDENPSRDDVNKIEAELQRLGIDYAFYRYDGAGHAFQNFLQAERYREAATRDSWLRTGKFLKRHLG